MVEKGSTFSNCLEIYKLSIVESRKDTDEFSGKVFNDKIFFLSELQENIN